MSPDENAILVLFAGLRDALMPIDYDRIRWWGGWPGQLQELGFMD